MLSWSRQANIEAILWPQTDDAMVLELFNIYTY